ncbi:MAG TPA: 1-(5-phosphoribosyl)-5-[(5-phosphoribosylamino)methylideneamino]imidazole-4-carboxamide isomerase [Steroidobacteraceae bacterium]|nr:1-(5-phosphoribosyl)-5-[(5-phosphoribosylamino)methylideneamino]imidazole-4-carboxamide isomerase [Steroidobacteraceae bacterium]
MLLIPAIDLRGGRCVRLYQGDFAAETRYEHSPRDLLEKYRALGSSWVHVVDLDGARDGTLGNRQIILDLAARPGLKLQVGGGIRSADAVEDLISNGVERVVIGSAAVERPDDVIGWASRFGAERICLALDVRHDRRGEPQLRTRGWKSGTAISLWEALALYPAAAVRHVLCTDIERDGALTGPNLDLYREAAERFPRIAWQASGGVRDAADLAALAGVGAAAAVSGKALLEKRIKPEELRPYLPDASSPVSTSETARS